VESGTELCPTMMLTIEHSGPTATDKMEFWVKQFYALRNTEESEFNTANISFV